MTIDEVFNHYKCNWGELIREVGLGVNTPRYWRKIGYIPIPMQNRIERATRGALKADYSKHN